MLLKFRSRFLFKVHYQTEVIPKLVAKVEHIGVDKVEKRENKYPYQINEMPVKANYFNSLVNVS